MLFQEDNLPHDNIMCYGFVRKGLEDKYRKTEAPFSKAPPREVVDIHELDR